jgi:hypothetical protein
MSATSLTCTHRTGRSIAFFAASIVGRPRRISGSIKISATVGQWKSAELGTFASSVVHVVGQRHKAVRGMKVILTRILSGWQKTPRSCCHDKSLYTL